MAARIAIAGIVSTRDQQPEQERAQRALHDDVGAGAHGAAEQRVEQQADQERDPHDHPDPAEARHDQPAPQQPPREPWDHAVERVAEPGRADDDVIAAGSEVGRSIQRPAGDDHVAVHHRALLDRQRAADHDERVVDDRGAGDPDVTEHGDKVPAHPALDHHVAEDGPDVLDFLALPEREVLADADDWPVVAERRFRLDLDLGTLRRLGDDGRSHRAGRGTLRGQLRGRERERHRAEERRGVRPGDSHCCGAPPRASRSSAVQINAHASDNERASANR